MTQLRQVLKESAKTRASNFSESANHATQAEALCKFQQKLGHGHLAALNRVKDAHATSMLKRQQGHTSFDSCCNNQGGVNLSELCTMQIYP